MEYIIPANSVCNSEIIKKSHFICYLEHVTDIEAAKSVITFIKLQHPDAHHHCWAYIAGAPMDPLVLGCSDDGEPRGTAGKPILAQLQGSGLGEIVAVVVRYYGGILLGKGGLVKAYSNSVKLALQQVKNQIKRVMKEYKLKCGYQELSRIESILANNDGQIVQVIYGEDIVLIVNVPKSNIDAITIQLRDISRGKLVLLPIEQILPIPNLGNHL